MTMEEVLAFEPPPFDRDCYLFMWRLASMPEEPFRVIRKWGFVPKTEVVWLKTTKTGKIHFGMGHHFRSCHETAIVAARGRPSRLAANIRDTFAAPVGEEHSQKPEEFFDLVEEFCPGPRVELFARRHRRGWRCFGDEVGKLPPVG